MALILIGAALLALVLYREKKEDLKEPKRNSP